MNGLCWKSPGFLLTTEPLQDDVFQMSNRTQRALSVLVVFLSEFCWRCTQGAFCATCSPGSSGSQDLQEWNFQSFSLWHQRLESQGSTNGPHAKFIKSAFLIWNEKTKFSVRARHRLTPLCPLSLCWFTMLLCRLLTIRGLEHKFAHDALMILALDPSMSRWLYRIVK